ncbi:MAG: tRNA lysidine(34) synthetase TilS [Pyrinomonadaceae bacterium]
MRTENENGRRVSRFAWRLGREWLRLGLPSADGHIVVAVSGGADSTALLLAMHELCSSQRLALKLTAAHLNHCLRADESDADAAWLVGLTTEYEIPFVVERADTNAEAARTQDNLEQAARRLRYNFLARTAANVGAKHVLTAHTMDDQAETMLLRLMRGSGLEGLGGMKPARDLSPGTDVILARPLMSKFRRAEILEYCTERGIEPRQDAMNHDLAFSRVAVRHELLPLMERFNPRLVETLAQTAELIRTDNDSLDSLAMVSWAGAFRHNSENGIDVRTLQELDTGLRRRVIRLWLGTMRGDLRRIEAVHLRAIEQLLEPGRAGRVAELPGGARVQRNRGWLLFQEKDS